MPVLCIGPVCIPLNLLLPFLLGLAHHYGWLKWIKTEWLTFTYWRQQFSRHKTQASDEATEKQQQQQQTGAGTATDGPAEYICEGGVCRLPPLERDADDAAARVEQRASSRRAAPPDPPAAPDLRHRPAAVTAGVTAAWES